MNVKIGTFLKRKSVRLALIILGFIVALFIAIVVIHFATLPNLLKDMDSTQTSAIHEIKYSVPNSWEYKKDKSSDILKRYVEKFERESVGNKIRSALPDAGIEFCCSLLEIIPVVGTPLAKSTKLLIGNIRDKSI